MACLTNHAAHHRLLGSLRDHSVGPPEIPDSDEPPVVPSQAEKIRSAHVVLGALMGTALIRNMLCAAFGLSILCAVGAVRSPGSSIALSHSCTLAGLAGCCLIVLAAWGLPGRVSWLEVSTEAGFYGNEKHASAVRNRRIRQALESWMARLSPTPWLRSGEACTVFPFLWKAKRASSLRYERVWVDTSDGERVASDWVFPEGGYNPDRPVVLILPGMAPHKHWTKTSEFVADAAWHLSTRMGMTAVVFVPRGSMDTKVKEHTFHSARVTDVREVVLMTQKVLRRVAVDTATPPLFVSAYSMGAYILANYCGQYGADAQIAGGICFSGLYDVELGKKFEYSRKTWQVPLAHRMKKAILTGQGTTMAVEKGLDVERVMSVSDMIAFDEEFTSPFHGFSSPEEFFSSGSVAGDEKWRRVAVPLLAVASRDDPITHGDAQRAQEMSEGNSNMLFLITDRGGHVGWPQGWKPWEQGYDFMNQAITVFIDGVLETQPVRVPTTGPAHRKGPCTAGPQKPRWRTGLNVCWQGQRAGRPRFNS